MNFIIIMIITVLVVNFEIQNTSIKILLSDWLDLIIEYTRVLNGYWTDLFYNTILNISGLLAYFV